MNVNTVNEMGLRTKLVIEVGVGSVGSVARLCAFCNQFDVVMRPVMFIDFKGTTMMMCSDCTRTLYGDRDD